MSRPPPGGPGGLADQPLDVQRDRVLAARDGFLDVAAAVEEDQPSRLPGWSRHDVCVHLGDRPG